LAGCLAGGLNEEEEEERVRSGPGQSQIRGQARPGSEEFF
jgi:hypothetical protein